MRANELQEKYNACKRRETRGSAEKNDTESVTWARMLLQLSRDNTQCLIEHIAKYI